MWCEMSVLLHWEMIQEGSHQALGFYLNSGTWLVPGKHRAQLHDLYAEIISLVCKKALFLLTPLLYSFFCLLWRVVSLKVNSILGTLHCFLTGHFKQTFFQTDELFGDFLFLLPFSMYSCFQRKAFSILRSGYRWNEKVFNYLLVFILTAQN